uniref:Uncharacterized protein n=1 Tax=Loa loa TaxID=7209 RepID=A0A1I7VGI1_LOALO
MHRSKCLCTRLNDLLLADWPSFPSSIIAVYFGNACKLHERMGLIRCTQILMFHLAVRRASCHVLFNEVAQLRLRQTPLKDLNLVQNITQRKNPLRKLPDTITTPRILQPREGYLPTQSVTTIEAKFNAKDRVYGPLPCAQFNGAV